MRLKMSITYGHTNIICEDWQRLADFYTELFDCEFVPPKREQTGQWLEDGTGVKGASLEGVHLRLPGHGDNGPTLEIYSYGEMYEKPEPLSNRKGFGHIAFCVDDVQEKFDQVLEKGGSAVGKVVTREVPGAGTITFAYVADPEGNIIELQKWS